MSNWSAVISVFYFYFSNFSCYSQVPFIQYEQRDIWMFGGRYDFYYHAFMWEHECEDECVRIKANEFDL